MMAPGLLSSHERVVAEAVRGLALGNPFLPERLELERQALGDAFIPGPPVWSVDLGKLGMNPNEVAIQEWVQQISKSIRQRLAAGAVATDDEQDLCENLILYDLYYRYQDSLFQEVKAESPSKPKKLACYQRFREDVREMLAALPRAAVGNRPQHLFALFFQVRRAFHHIFRFILGGSMAAARLRAAVWQSIFTHDMRRYRRSLYGRMEGISTLIIGPSGTGKELVASAIGLSRYIPFDPQTQAFTEDFRETFLPLNLSALSPSLIESELFGHRKGSFTGAVANRAGYLEGRGSVHTVFLDEIGDLDRSIQVKLLRVLQERRFQRIGETTPREFGGKIIAATNQDLGAEMAAGCFREDLYYRLCSDLIVTPSLFEQVCDSPGEMRSLILLLVQRLVDAEDHDSLADEVEHWVTSKLPPGYQWPGNVRELEQCVRSILVRGEYRPLSPAARGAGGPLQRLVDQLCHGDLTADELLSRYCTLIYAQTGQYESAARRLQLDRRTVKRKIDPELLDELRQAGVTPAAPGFIAGKASA
jgi:transcriptional regulator with AAA-type ATPase domain